MSGSYLDGVSPIVSSGKYRSDLFDSDSNDTFSSGSLFSEEGGTLHSSKHDEHMILPPRLSSTCHKQKQLLGIKNTKPHQTDTNTPNTIKINDHEISIWEQWLIHKLEVEREKSKVKKIEEKQKNETEKEEKFKKMERQKKAQERHQEWVEEKLLKLKLQKKAHERQVKIKQELETAKKEQIKLEAKQKYEHWKDKHDQLEKENKLKKKHAKEKEHKLREEKERENEEHYQRWLENNKERINSLVLQKQLKNPTPTYVNPNPWVAPSPLNGKPSPRSPRSAQIHARSHPRSEQGHRRPETHSPMRVGSAKSRKPTESKFGKSETPLRFAGIKSRTNSGRKPAKASAPVPLQGSLRSTYRIKDNASSRPWI